MQAVRTIAKIENNILKVEIPIHFKTKEVEIIILPYSKEATIDEKGNNDFQKLLLSGPIMTEEDELYINDKRKAFNQWK
jgi:hypothetical protein